MKRYVNGEAWYDFWAGKTRRKNKPLYVFRERDRHVPSEHAGDRYTEPREGKCGGWKKNVFLGLSEKTNFLEESWIGRVNFYRRPATKWTSTRIIPSHHRTARSGTHSRPDKRPTYLYGSPARCIVLYWWPQRYSWKIFHWKKKNKKPDRNRAQDANLNWCEYSLFNS